MSLIYSKDRVELTSGSKITGTLQKGVYLLKRDIRTGSFYLTIKPDFILPKKIYGDHSVVDRWLESWKKCSKNMGICLNGLRGSGKTITAQMFCIKSEAPVILVTEPWDGDEFKDFLTHPSLNGAIIFIDEFEKTYVKDVSQNTLLSLMDGMYDTHLVFLLTMNEKSISSHMNNRLGRIKYLKNYKNLEESVIEEVIKDRLNNKHHAAGIHEVFEKINMSSFDVLVNLIDDMNMFNEDAISSARHLNLVAESSYFGVIEIINGHIFEVFGIQTTVEGLKTTDIQRKSVPLVDELIDKNIQEGIDVPWYEKLSEKFGTYIDLGDQCSHYKFSKLGDNAYSLTSPDGKHEFRFKREDRNVSPF